MRIIRKKIGRPRKYEDARRIGDLCFEGYTDDGNGWFQCRRCFSFFTARIADVRRKKIKQCPDCRGGKC